MIENPDWFVQGRAKKSKMLIIKTRPALDNDHQHKAAIDMFRQVNLEISQ